jgi:hypothetical protein
LESWHSHGGTRGTAKEIRKKKFKIKNRIFTARYKIGDLKM